MKVRYLGETDPLCFTNGGVYDVMSVERGWYRIYVEALGDDYLFPPKLFEIVEGRAVKLEVCDCFIMDGRCCAVCTGDNIPRDLKINKIAIYSHVYDVLETRTGEAFGVILAVLVVDSEIPLRNGVYYGAI